MERHFPPPAKARAQELAHSLMEVLEHDVAAVTWMAPRTRAKALEKLARFYPDAWKDYRSVALRSDNFWANVAAGRKFAIQEDRQRVGKPTAPEQWQLSPSSSDAYIDFQRNEMVLPAGFLQPPAFSPEALDAANYGSLGAGLGHDMTHGIDATGADTDVLGRPINGWTDDDRKHFQERARCVMDQLNGYVVKGDVHLDGKRVLNDAIGDLAGVRIAFRALELKLKGHRTTRVDGFTPQQQFFLAWAQARAEAILPETRRMLLSTDIHPLPSFRVNGTLANLPQSQKAFSCNPGAPMVRPPEKRCAVW